MPPLKEYKFVNRVNENISIIIKAYDFKIASIILGNIVKNENEYKYIIQ
jgi:hypothetical protein